PNDSLHATVCLPARRNMATAWRSSCTRAMPSDWVPILTIKALTRGSWARRRMPSTMSNSRCRRISMIWLRGSPGGSSIIPSVRSNSRTSGAVRRRRIVVRGSNSFAASTMPLSLDEHFPSGIPAHKTEIPPVRYRSPVHGADQGASGVVVVQRPQAQPAQPQVFGVGGFHPDDFRVVVAPELVPVVQPQRPVLPVAEPPPGAARQGLVVFVPRLPGAGGDFPGSLVEEIAAAAGHPAPAPTEAGHADHQLLRGNPHFQVGNYADVQAEFAGRRVIRGRVQLGRVVRGQVPVAVEVVALDDPEIQ